MKVRILVGSINEKGVGKYEKDFVYEVPDKYAIAYIRLGWACPDSSDNVRDAEAGVTAIAADESEETDESEPVSSIENNEEVKVEAQPGGSAGEKPARKRK